MKVRNYHTKHEYDADFYLLLRQRIMEEPQEERLDTLLLVVANLIERVNLPDRSKLEIMLCHNLDAV